MYFVLKVLWVTDCTESCSFHHLMLSGKFSFSVPGCRGSPAHFIVTICYELFHYEETRPSSTLYMQDRLKEVMTAFETEYPNGVDFTPNASDVDFV